MEDITERDRRSHELAPLHSGASDKAALLGGYNAIFHHCKVVMARSRELSKFGHTMNNQVIAEDMATHARLASDHAAALAKALADHRNTQDT